MATLQNVADAAGVSIASASLVLSGKSKGRVSAITEARVQQAADDLDYVGNAAAQSLRTRKTNVIGFLSDLIATTPFAVDMIAGANRAAMEADQLLMLFNTEGVGSNEEAAVAEFLRHGVDKTIVAAMYHREIHVPTKLLPNIVVLDGYATDRTIPAIVPDERQGVRSVLEHLSALGHRRIAYLGEVERKGAAANLRLDAFRECVVDIGLDSDEALVAETSTDRAEAEADAARLISRGRPTAIFCYNDLRAHAAYSAARHAGLSIPEDLSVVGFDNLELIAELLDPPLTTVELPHAQMGEWAVRTVLDSAPTRAGQVYPVKHHCQLIVRGSTGPAR